MSTYHFNRDLSRAPFTVKVDTAARYGYFEHDLLGDNCGGGLWFEADPTGDLMLFDYDGVFALPFTVALALHQAGVRVDPEFWPDGIGPGWNWCCRSCGREHEGPRLKAEGCPATDCPSHHEEAGLPDPTVRSAS